MHPRDIATKSLDEATSQFIRGLNFLPLPEYQVKLGCQRAVPRKFTPAEAHGQHGGPAPQRNSVVLTGLLPSAARLALPLIFGSLKRVKRFRPTASIVQRLL